MARIFICYRRSDTRWVAGRIYDRLTEVISKENVFLDVSNIEPGEDFVERIKIIVENCDILLSIIGPNWLSVKDEQGRRRIDDKTDLVRIELATALRRKIRVIPILIDNALMPNSHQLPNELKSLANRNAKEVSFNRFHTDLDSLLRVLQTLLESSEEQKQEKSSFDGFDLDGLMESAGLGNVNSVLPLTVSLETLGGESSPLIDKGTILPAEEVRVFSTAEDNQTAVTIHLLWGESRDVSKNLSLGRFDLTGLPLAEKGIPQIEVTTKIDKTLLLTVTAVDLASGSSEILDSVDLSQIEIPNEMLNDVTEKPIVQESPRDVDTSNIFKSSIFKNKGDHWQNIGSKSFEQELNIHRTVNVNYSDAINGTKRQTTNGEGKKLNYTIPAGIEDGTRLRLRGQGKTDGKQKGDLIINIKISD